MSIVKVKIFHLCLQQRMLKIVQLKNIFPFHTDSSEVEPQYIDVSFKNTKLLAKVSNKRLFCITDKLSTDCPHTSLLYSL